MEISLSTITRPKVPEQAGAEWLKCFVTDDSPRFAKLAAHFLGTAVNPPTWVAPEQLYSASETRQTARRAV
jgi:hypothetical protein